MSDPKIQKFGRNCEIIDNSTEDSISRLAPKGLKEIVKEKIGCGWDDEPSPLCNKINKEVNRLFENSFFKGAVSYFAKWKFKDLTLKKDGRPVNMGDSSPLKVTSELAKCVTNKK